MTKRRIITQVYRALLARSGNNCAFPGCVKPLFNQNSEFIAQLCHIEGVAGERYNPSLSDEQINSYRNLMFMCYEHHVETNNEKRFTADVLRKIKIEHEGKFILSPMHVDMAHIFSLRKETEEYWEQVKIVNTKHHVVPDLKIDIQTDAGYDELNEKLDSTLSSLESLFSIIDEADRIKYWEIFNLGLINHMTISKVLIEQMRIKYYEAHLSNNPHDNTIKNKLEELRKAFIENTAKSTGHAD